MRDPTRARPSTQIHHYFISLMVADLIQALGSVLNIQWIKDSSVEENSVCTAQGALKQVGDVAVAMSTLVIAVHTARVLIFKISFPSIVPKLVVLAIWVFTALMLSVGFGLHHAQDIQFYGNTGYWCWITEDYPSERITLEYLWLWVAAIVNIVCYAAIFLVIKGYAHYDSSKRTFQRSPQTFSVTSSHIPHSSRTSAIAKQMLYYPAVYLVCIVPMTVSRFRAFAGYSTPFGVTVFSSILFSGSGLFNVLLFRYTRPSLLPATRSHGAFPSQPPVEVSVKLEAFKHTSSPDEPGNGSPDYPHSEHSYPPPAHQPTGSLPITFGRNRHVPYGSESSSRFVV
ncbi:hypothetical protein DL96DRAFT_1575105 [Flagelloscypha sp. PMI_526]|nr:hypothetical protein DL96DRAFT_1575105 [Flagelloscypha sp. PMI_526]